MFTLTTDTAIDIFRNELDAMGVPYIPLTFTIDGITYEDRFTSNEDFEDFYAKIKKGAQPVTSQITPIAHEEFFEKVYAKNKLDIVHITLSSGLSKTYESACMAADSFMKRNPDARVYIVDPLSATSATMPLFEKALAFRDEGAPASEAAEALRAYSHRIQTYVVPNDLFHLMRGGRLSAAAAIVGSAFKIKPIIVLNEEGKLVVYKKALGFNRAIKIIIEHIEEYCPNPCEKKFWIASAGAHEQVDYAKNQIEKRFPGAKVQIGWIGPVIGAHTGFGTMGVVFEGNSRLM